MNRPAFAFNIIPFVFSESSNPVKSKIKCVSPTTTC